MTPDEAVVLVASASLAAAVFVERPRGTFSAQVEALGFQVEDMSEAGEGERPYGIHVSRVDPVDPASIDAVTIELTERAAELGGDYDGWETQVIRPES